MFIDEFFKIIHRPEFPIEKLTFLLKDTNTVRDTYDGVIHLNIEPAERPGRREALAKIEKERDKEKERILKETKKGAQPSAPKIVFDVDWSEKIVIMPTLTEKKMVIFKNIPFGIMMRNNILECIYLHAKIDSETETKEAIRAKIEEFVNSIENACIKKLKAIDNLEEFTYDISIN